MSARTFVITFAVIVLGIFILPASVAAQGESFPSTCEYKNRGLWIGASILSRAIGFVSPFGSSDLFPKQFDYYQCTGDVPEKAVQIGKTTECAEACTDAAGSILGYEGGTDPLYFCLNAAEPKTCEVTDTQGQPVIRNVAGTSADKPACSNLEFGCWLMRVLNAFAGLLGLIILPFALLMKAIATALASVLNIVINYVVSVPISPSNPNTTPVVKEIWEFSRNLANNFFVLLMAIIGFATILRIQTYQWQKLIPSLLIAVLLINFSGVLVGFVVDMANIVTHAFLKEVPGSTDWRIPTFVGADTLALHVGEIIFYFLLSFAYLATMLLFVVRTVVLWIIAAIAPLAFGLYVLPATQSYWQQWFKALFQWAIMGIPISFALFFASKAMSLTTQNIGGTGTYPAFFAQAAGPFTAAVILLVGVSMSLAGAPAISQNVMNLGKKWGVGLAKSGALAGGSAFWRRYGGKISKPAETVGTAGQRMSNWGSKQRGLNRVAGISAVVAGWGTKRVGQGISVGTGVIQKRVTMRDAGEIGGAEKEAAQIGDAKLVANEINKEALKGIAANRNRVVGLINGMIKNGDADDLQEYINTGLLDGKMVGRAILDGRQRIGPNGYRTIIKALGGMIYSDPTKLGWGVQKDAAGNPLTDEYGSVRIQGGNAAETEFLDSVVKREIVEKLNAAEITNLGILGNYIKNYHSDTWKAAADVLIRRLVKERGGDFLGAILRKPERREGRTQLGKFVQSYIDTHFEYDPQKTHDLSNIPDEYLNSFASAGKYLYSSGAASAGIVGGYRDNAANAFNQSIRQEMQRRGTTPPPGGARGTGQTGQQGGQRRGDEEEPGFDASRSQGPGQ